MSFLSLRRKRPSTAAEWFAARCRGADARLDRQFQEWLAASPSHGEEYALCEIVWEVSREAAEREPVPPPKRRISRPLVLGALASGMAVALAGLVIWFRPAPAQTWATAPGEQRTLVLDDGSRVTLNTRTSIEVRIAHGSRDVTLRDGEAFFEVTKDPERPFTVHTRIGSSRVLGTRFNVYLDRDHLTVTTEQGKVLVDGNVPGHGVVIGAGKQAELWSGASTALVKDVDVSTTLNWLTQRLEADNAPLSTLLSDFSRYSTLPVRAENAQIAALRVSAVLRTGDLDSLAATLKGALNLELVQRDGEYVVVPMKDTDKAEAARQSR
jgi:transmembrane sensor